jgi:hypothetical protein
MSPFRSLIKHDIQQRERRKKELPALNLTASYFNVLTSGQERGKKRTSPE